MADSIPNSATGQYIKIAVNPELAQQFHQSGYLVVEDIVDCETVLHPLISEYKALLSSLCDIWIQERLLPAKVTNYPFADQIRAAYSAGLDFFQPLDISLPPGEIAVDTPFHAGRAVFNLITDNDLLDVVEQLIGSELTSNPIQHVRIKPPATELSKDEVRAHITHTDWHQDRAVTLEDADTTDMVTVWVAVTDATVENGCLQVIPGSHRESMLQHCPSPQLSIPQSQFDVQRAVPLPVKAGGAVLFHPQTIHSSLTNTTDSIRWSFDLRYNVTGQPTGRPMFPDFVVRSKQNPASVTVNATQWRCLWEDARASLAAEPPLVIHRWSDDSVYCA